MTIGGGTRSPDTLASTNPNDDTTVVLILAHLLVKVTIPVMVIHLEPEVQDVLLVTPEHSRQRANKLLEVQVAVVVFVHGAVDVLEERLLSIAKCCTATKAMMKS